jgi:hypothetical protein
MALASALLYGFGMKRTFGYGLSFGVVWAALALACSAAPGEDLAEGTAPAAVGEVEPAVAAIEAPVEGASLEASEAPPVQRGTFEAGLVVHVGKRHYLVLDAQPSLAGAAGRPEVVSGRDDGVYAVTRGVEADKVPASATALQGQRLHLAAKGLGVCSAFAEAPVLLGRVSPDGSDDARFRGEGRDEDDRPIPAPSRDVMAEELWTMSEGAIVLAMPLRPEGKCDAATYAVPSTSHVGSAVAPADDATTTRGLAAFRALPEYTKHAADYLAWAKEMDSTVTAPTWDRHGESDPKVHEVRLGGARYVWVSAGVTDGGCGDFGAELSALFREGDAGALELVRTFDGASFELEALVEREGGVELVFPEAHVAPDGSEIERLEVRSYGCRC